MKKKKSRARSLTYKDAGVDIEKSDRLLTQIKADIRATFRSEVLGDVGSFGGLFAPRWSNYHDPVLVSSIDGVGTKLMVASLVGTYDTVGIDIVAHCANDIVVQGAEPLFFLDYIGTSSLEPEVYRTIIRGIATGCKEVGCALIGGETAEMPGIYVSGKHDIVGAMVGIVERARIIDGCRIAPGDVLLGLASDGLHTNGYSLARKVLFEAGGYAARDFLKKLGRTLGEELLIPHKSYSKAILRLVGTYEIKGMAHITGGGLPGNIPRILPEHCRAVLSRKSWKVPPIFTVIQESGGVADQEMYRVFNMGVGMVLVLDSAAADPVTALLKDEGIAAGIIGEIAPGERTVEIE